MDIETRPVTHSVVAIQLHHIEEENKLLIFLLTVLYISL